jgi:hypothetical protein
MANNRKKNQTSNPSLSSNITENVNSPSNKKREMDEITQKVFASINNLELQKSIDRFMKESSQKNQIALRDLSLLKSLVGEYLDVFLLFGYNTEGERIVIQNFKNARDRDAIMEFLKTIFLKQQHENFLDE